MAAISLTAAGTAYTQNFNALSNTAGSTTNDLNNDPQPLPGWFLNETGLGARDNDQYAVDTGGSNTGDVFSYGAAGNTDRALGSLQSGTLIPTMAPSSPTIPDRRSPSSSSPTRANSGGSRIRPRHATTGSISRSRPTRPA